MPKNKRGYKKPKRPLKEHDKIALRHIPVEPVKGIPRDPSLVKAFFNPKPKKKNKKEEEDLRNQGKVLCGSLHPKNKLACVVPVEEHGDKHETWNLTNGGNSEVYTKLQWPVT